jgi:hypothetical protein
MGQMAAAEVFLDHFDNLVASSLNTFITYRMGQVATAEMLLDHFHHLVASLLNTLYGANGSCRGVS